MTVRDVTVQEEHQTEESRRVTAQTTYPGRKRFSPAIGCGQLLVAAAALDEVNSPESGYEFSEEGQSVLEEQWLREPGRDGRGTLGFEIQRRAR